MNTFRADENLNSRKFYNACDAAQQVDLRRFPSELQGASDPQLLPIIYRQGVPLVTMDRTVAQHNIAFIPDDFPGIVILAYSSKNLRNLSIPSALELLRVFRLEYPEWKETSLVGRVFMITEAYIYVEKIQSRRLVTVGTVVRSNSGWQQDLSALLASPIDSSAPTIITLGIGNEQFLPQTSKALQGN